MADLKIAVEFDEGFNGKLIAKNGEASVGSGEGQLAPYDMLLGALASCLYATFIDIINKKKITFDKARVLVEGTKRDEIPGTLKQTDVVIEVTNASEEKGVLRSAELAQKYCSVFETISKVSEMSLEVKFL